MKKTLISVFLLALLLLSACSSDIRQTSTATLNPLSEEPIETVISQNDNFVIKAIESDGRVRYSYTVTAKDGTVMESALCAEEPRVAAIGDHLIGIRFTQDDHVFSRYFDYVNKRISESFRDAFWDNGVLVAYHGYENGHILVVQDIFDEGAYFVKTPVDCSSWQLTVYNVAEENGSLKVSYYMGTAEDSNNGKGTAFLPLEG